MRYLRYVIAYFAPKAVEHYLGKLSAPGILLDVVVVEFNALFLLVLLDVGSFLLFCHCPSWPSIGLLFLLHEFVDIAA